jgi:hypothetical protein
MKWNSISVLMVAFGLFFVASSDRICPGRR